MTSQQNLYDYTTKYDLLELFNGKVMEFTVLKLDEVYASELTDYASELTVYAEEIKVIEDTIKKNLVHDYVNLSNSDIFAFDNLSNDVLINQIKHIHIQLLEEDEPMREMRLALEISLITTELLKRMDGVL